MTHEKAFNSANTLVEAILERIKGWQRLRAGKVLSSSYRLLINHQSIKYFRTSEKRVPIELEQYEQIHWEDALNREVQGKENIIHI